MYWYSSDSLNTKQRACIHLEIFFCDRQKNGKSFFWISAIAKATCDNPCDVASAAILSVHADPVFVSRRDAIAGRDGTDDKVWSKCMDESDGDGHSGISQTDFWAGLDGRYLSAHGRLFLSKVKPRVSCKDKDVCRYVCTKSFGATDGFCATWISPTDVHFSHYGTSDCSAVTCKWGQVTVPQ